MNITQLERASLWGRFFPTGTTAAMCRSCDFGAVYAGRPTSIVCDFAVYYP